MSYIVESRLSIQHCVVVGLLLGAASCETGADSGTSTPTRADSAGRLIVTNDLSESQASCAVGPDPMVTIGAAEGAESQELYRVFGAARLSDGRIALVNQGSQQLRIYDQSGDLVHQAGREGGGPGEFRNAFNLWVLPGDTIWVGDYRPWRFLLFDPQGEWVRTVQAEPPYVNTALTSVLDNGRFVLAARERSSAPGSQFQPRSLTLALHDATGAMVDTIGSYPNGRWGRLESDPSALTLYPLFESFTRVTTTGSLVVIGHTSKPEFMVLSVTDGIRPIQIVRWSVEDRTITDGDIAAERERIAAPYEDVDPDLRSRLVEPLVSDERPIAEEFPAFGHVMAGRDGRIWVSDYDRPGDDPRTQWLAFAADGAFACRALMPDVAQILEFGADYILVEDHDELGVERILQYSLSAPSSVGGDHAS